MQTRHTRDMNAFSMLTDNSCFEELYSRMDQMFTSNVRILCPLSAQFVSVSQQIKMSLALNIFSLMLGLCLVAIVIHIVEKEYLDDKESIEQKHHIFIEEAKYQECLLYLERMEEFLKELEDELERGEELLRSKEQCRNVCAQYPEEIQKRKREREEDKDFEDHIVSTSMDNPNEDTLFPDADW